MLVCVDVDYRVRGAVAGAVLFREWGDAEGAGEETVVVGEVAPYVAGEFYRRELPCLMVVLGRVRVPVELVVIDGYVWLEKGVKPGLGAHLYEALGRVVPVVGVAKTRFAAADAVECLRGGSGRPLFVTAAGVDAGEAAGWVGRMHGGHRVPTLLKRVDRVCRSARGGE